MLFPFLAKRNRSAMRPAHLIETQSNLAKIPEKSAFPTTPPLNYSIERYEPKMSLESPIFPAVFEAHSEPAHHHKHRFILQKVQPALLGLMDGSVSTLAPL